MEMWIQSGSSCPFTLLSGSQPLLPGTAVGDTGRGHAQRCVLQSSQTLLALTKICILLQGLGELVIFGEFPPAASVNISPNIFLLLNNLSPTVKTSTALFLFFVNAIAAQNLLSKGGGWGWGLAGRRRKGFIHTRTGSPC